MRSHWSAKTSMQSPQVFSPFHQVRSLFYLWFTQPLLFLNLFSLSLSCLLLSCGLDAVHSVSPPIPLLSPFLVEYLIGNPNANVSPDHDGLSNLFLNKTGESIPLHLSIIFNKNHEANHFSSLQEEALNISIHKGTIAALLRVNALFRSSPPLSKSRKVMPGCPSTFANS